MITSQPASSPSPLTQALQLARQGRRDAAGESEKPAVPVWQLARSEFVLQDLAKGQALPEESVRQIVSLLKANQLSRRE
jgi:hypothetical protein